MATQEWQVGARVWQISCHEGEVAGLAVERDASLRAAEIYVQFLLPLATLRRASAEEIKRRLIAGLENLPMDYYEGLKGPNTPEMTWVQPSWEKFEPQEIQGEWTQIRYD